MMQRFSGFKFPWSAAILALAVLPVSTWAATLTITSIADDLNPGGGLCTLRGAVAAINGAANANGCTGSSYGTSDTIVFADSLAGQTVQFTAANGGQIAITQSLTIQGPAVAQSDASQRVTLRGGGAGSNFRLLNVTTPNIALSVQDLNFSDAILGSGGAVIYNFNGIGSVTLTRCALTNNAGGLFGGAIYAHTVTVSDSSFSGNSATSSGGAILGDMVTVSNSTFSGNSVSGPNPQGGAIYVLETAMISNSTFIGNSVSGTTNIQGGAIWVGDSLTARHLTLVDNTATEGAAIYFANLNGGSNVDLSDSLIVGNNSNAHCFVQIGQPGTFNGSYNLGWSNAVNDTSCGAANAIDASATARAAIVSPTLLDNGGPTLTLALPTGSPAIGNADPTPGGSSQMLDAGLTWVDATLDQRGFARKAVTAGRDLGAYEAAALPPPPLPGPPDDNTRTHADVTSDEQGLVTITGFFVPSQADRGLDGTVFVFAWLPPSVTFAPNTYWVLDSASNWHLYTDCRVTPAVYVGTLQTLSNIPIFPIPVDLMPYSGSELYIGYGLGGYPDPSGEACNYMQVHQNWVKVYRQP